MYAVYLDGSLFYSPGLHDQTFEVIDPVLTQELNEAGTFTCKVPPGHSMYSAIHKLTSIIEVFDGDTRLWRGRVLETTEDFFRNIEIYAEGALSFFNDSVVRPYSYSGTVVGYLQKLVTDHNAQVDAQKRFEVGNVTVTDANDYITRASSDYPLTIEELKNKTIDLMGGYLMTHKSNGVEYLDYLAESGGRSSQVISFGTNLLDMEQYITGADVYTVMIPIGSEGLTVASVNNNKDYIESETGIALYGRIVRMVEWQDVTIAQNLLTKAQAELARAINLACQMTIKAADLSMIGVNIKALQVGLYNRVVSLPHGVDDLYQCTEIELNLADPAESTYTFGMSYATMADMLNQQRAAQALIVAEVEENDENAEQTADALNLMAQEVSTDYTAQLDALDARVTALEEQNT